MRLTYESELAQISVSDPEAREVMDDDTFATQELGFLLADLIRRISPPRPLHVLAVCVDCLADERTLNVERCGVSAAEHDFCVSAQAANEAWQCHDNGLSDLEFVDRIREILANSKGAL